MQSKGGAKLIQPLSSSPGRRLTVLHVDDDPNDSELLRAAASAANAQFDFKHVADGEDAIQYLKGTGPYADRNTFPSPDLILLDLKMPRTTGFELLDWIRSRPKGKSVPVIILSGSELKDDIKRARAVGADSYLVKPLGFEALINLVRELEVKWCGIAAASGV